MVAIHSYFTLVDVQDWMVRHEFSRLLVMISGVILPFEMLGMITIHALNKKGRDLRVLNTAQLSMAIFFWKVMIHWNGSPVI
jgi:hypothetical protein